jgi:hypothetical protein
VYFVATIKPTSTLYLRWRSRRLTCGVLDGVGFAYRGRDYIADRVTPDQMALLRKHVAVKIEATQVRVIEPVDDAVVNSADADGIPVVAPVEVPVEAPAEVPVEPPADEAPIPVEEPEAPKATEAESGFSRRPRGRNSRGR